MNSTGLKVFGAGEWQETKHGKASRRRSWRKLHLGLDLETGQIECSELTTDDIGDPSAVPGLLDQTEEPVRRFLADGAYDGTATRNEITQRFADVEILIRPPKTAVAGPEAEINPTARDLDVLAIKAHGRMAWQKSTGYDQRARVETQMGCWKSVIGERLKSRTLDNQRTESRIGVSVLNKMTSLGHPTFERVS
ncbi:IS5 family transposase [Roseibium aggregatum]|uniref:IS5 family transposase n=1 Tax=Roseibium aggregatum TaxID=187304 RepID=UPI00030DBE3C|nr:IS5 family transposase [Roseibium aggregatum]